MKAVDSEATFNQATKVYPPLRRISDQKKGVL